MANKPYDNDTLCRKILEVFPDIGQCGIDVQVVYDAAAEAYAVTMEREGREIKTYLDPDDATLCMAGDRCVKLGVQIGQVKGGTRH